MKQKTLPSLQRGSIKLFLLRVSLLFSAIGFLLIFVAGYSANKQSILDSALDSATEIAVTVADTTQQLVQLGWKDTELLSFINKQHDVVKNYSAELVLRSQATQLDGQNDYQNLLNSAFESATAMSEVQQDHLVYVYPLIFNVNCADCNPDAAVVVSYDTKFSLDTVRDNLLTNLLILAPFPFLLAVFVIAYMNKRINHSIEGLESSIVQVNKVSDLKDFSIQEHPDSFEEFNRVYDKVEKLSDKLHDLAVDKDLLEFEITLLEKFVITSDVVRDWHDYINMLLIEINDVMPVYNLFSIFKVDDELFTLEVFWLRPPTEATKRWLNDEVHRRIGEHPMFTEGAELKIVHNIAQQSEERIEMNFKDIHLRTKSLVLEQPKIGGIVGIGINSAVAEDSTRLLVTSSILSTLINVVGSVKAIGKYTKDLEYYATRDPLTNLHNQRIFWEMLEYEMIRAERHEYVFSVLMIDLDNFKSVNDTFGHNFGDRVLQSVSDTVREQLRTGDFFARYGGDEFTIILPESDIEQAKVISERILQASHESKIMAPNGEAIDVAMSIGIAVYPDHADNGRDLFMFADNMMYKAKGAGKDQAYVPHDEDIIDVFRDINEKSVMINKAVKERSVVPYFQPLMRLTDGNIAATEVLCRIKTPEGTIMGAYEFIEIAEKMGIIHNLDFIMLEKALEQAIVEDYQGLLFVNISPRSLVLSEFIPEIVKIVEKVKIARERIVFEITERDTVKNMSLLKQFVNSLKSEGFKLAVDDFGSGFSSFHYLKHFPIDFVKIEGEFIANMVNDKRDYSVVKCIANLAKELEAETIAEFVESEEVLESIKEIDITYAQGYHIRRPMPYIIDPDKSVV
jgi:diguanylate cyclase (GGDEF)-like protein